MTGQIEKMARLQELSTAREVTEDLLPSVTFVAKSSMAGLRPSTAMLKYGRSKTAHPH